MSMTNRHVLSALIIIFVVSTFAKRLVTTEVVRPANNETLSSKERDNDQSGIIRSKLKRLEDLRAEAKELVAELRRSRITNFNLDQELYSADLGNKKSQRLKKWKKRLQRRVGRLTRRLAKLERTVKVQQRLAAKSVTTPRKPSTQARTADLSVLSTDSSPTSANKSRPGHHHSPCSTHDDCSPGHCCHILTDSSNKCIKHVLNETATCRHSCQCGSHLHCFHKNDAAAAEQSQCKQAHRNDVVQGSYKNTKLSVFKN